MANHKTKLRKKNKEIHVYLVNGDYTRVKTVFGGGTFTPEEFTALFMAVLEAYTDELRTSNTNEQIFEHFNNVFGIYLNKLIPDQKTRYNLSVKHKEFKDLVDNTLGKPETLEDKKDSESNRFAAYLLTRDILVNEMHLTEESADVLLNKRLKLNSPLKSPSKKWYEK